MANTKDTDAAAAGEISINFAESIVDGKTYDGPGEPKGFRALAKDGYYKVEIEEATPATSDKNNAVLKCVVRILDEDEAGARCFANVTCSGVSNTESKRPNIYSLYNLLLSAGRTQEQLNAFATQGKSMKLKDIAKGLTQPGKNIAYAQVRHKIAEQGKMAGKEVTEVSNFVLAATYEKQVELGRARWEKKLGDGSGFGHGATNGAAKNGAVPASMNEEQLNAAAAGI